MNTALINNNKVTVLISSHGYETFLAKALFDTVFVTLKTEAKGPPWRTSIPRRKYIRLNI